MEKLHERLAVAQLLTRVSFGFSLGVGVLKIFSSPTPNEKPNENLIDVNKQSCPQSPNPNQLTITFGNQ